MKFVILFVAVTQAIKMEHPPTSSPIYPDYFKDMEAAAADQHVSTMSNANVVLGRQQAGVAESAATISDYKTAHGCSA